ncbi:MAG: MBOAT family protein [Bacteroidetes bacterium]|nr:MBOAT family protein [Bacteroidota bacterium]
MIFSNSLFLLYFLPFFLLAYYLADPRFRNGLVLAASTFFFAWGAPVFVFILWASILVDYYGNQWMARSEGNKRRRLFILILLLNLALLMYFKYVNFFIDNFNEILKFVGTTEIKWTKIILPLGISFIVFQKLSYSIDVYRKTHPPAPALTDYAYYILMFPKLLAGPIIRYRDMAVGIEQGIHSIGYDERINGFFRFAVGLAKKVLIANVLGETVDTIFAMKPETMSTPLAWLGALGYTFQIYFDFSGYSDMAIGLANMMGFRFGENFNSPYIARSITDFWKRWHITLSNWLRDYVFLTLAYSASRRWRKNRYWGVKTEQWLYIWATSITMITCGFWHGAAWTFIIWGAFQGLIMILERLFLLKFYKKTSRYLGLLLTFIFIVTGWVLFRAKDVSNGLAIIREMWSFRMKMPEFLLTGKFISMLILAAVFSFMTLLPGMEARQMKLFSPQHSNLSHGVMTIAALLLFVISLSAITSSGFNPFIYFRF